MSRVIAALDNSAAARPVLVTACALAPVLGAAVEAVHVSNGPGHTARSSADSLRIPFRLIPGDALETLTQLAGESDVVAIVAGVRSRLIGRGAGHLAIALANTMTKPVVVVPPDCLPPDRLTRVLVAMEGKTGKERSLKRGVEIVAAAGLELVVVHVDDEKSIPSFSDHIAHEAEDYAREFLTRHCPGAPKATLELRLGVPADEILAAADKVSAQLLAIGWPQTSDPERGFVARELLARSPIPVLLVAVA
jgi:nucleotide-binding universal stress UspA family protein